MINDGLSPEILHQLRDKLFRCNCFQTNIHLRAIFVDARIAIWGDSLQDGSSIKERVDNLILTLQNKYDLYKRNALVLFLCVLSDLETGSLKPELLELSDQVEGDLIDDNDSTEREIRRALEFITEIEGNFEQNARPNATSLSSLDILLSPFEYERAEENRRAVFVSNKVDWNIAFWGGTKLFNKLRESTGSHIIVGTHGSGKTSLALGVYYYPVTSHRAVFVNEISELAILVQVALLNLNNILSNPRWFYSLHQDQQEFLLLFITTHLPRQVLETRLQHKLKQLLSQSPNTQQRHQENSVKLTDYVKLHLRFAHFSAQYELTQTLNLRTVWKHALSEIVDMMSVTHLKVILDVSANNSEQSILQDRLPLLSALCEQEKVIICLFLPESLEGKLEGLSLPVDHLTWSREDFVRMLQSRYQAFVGKRRWPGEYFENDEAFEFLVTNSNYNPRRFSQLWKIILHLAALDAPKEWINVTLAHINAGLNYLRVHDIMLKAT